MLGLDRLAGTLFPMSAIRGPLSEADLYFFKKKNKFQGFPGGAVVKNRPANAGDTGSGPGPGRSHMPRSS